MLGRLRLRAAVVGVLAVSACAAPDSEPTRLIGDIRLPAEVRVVAARVARGATLASLLRTHEVAEQEVTEFVNRAASVFDPRMLRVDQPYRVALAISGALRRFEYEIDNDRRLTVARDSDRFIATIDAIAKRTAIAAVAGAIDPDASSLFAALSRTGERVDLALALANVFTSDVDFNTELQVGDRFDLLVEKQYRERDARHVGETGETFTGYGPILAAAGLIRLGAPQRISAWLEPPDWLPAPGQGAIGLPRIAWKHSCRNWCWKRIVIGRNHRRR